MNIYSNFEDLIELREMFKNEISRKFITNAIKIALNLKEDKVAASLVAWYPIYLDKDIIDFAIQSDLIIFIQ